MSRSEELCLNGLSKRGFDRRLLSKPLDSIDFKVAKKFKSAFDVLQSYVENFSKIQEMGGGLAIVGGAGSGKSLLTTMLVKELWLRYSLTAHLTTCDDIFKSINSMWNDEDRFKHIFINTPFLVVDNVPSTLHQSRSVFPALEALLRGRMNAGRPTVFICGVSQHSLSSFPQTLVSLMQESMLFIDLDGVPDYRPKINALLKKGVGIGHV